MKKHTLEELLKNTEYYELTEEDREWLDMEPIGAEILEDWEPDIKPDTLPDTE